MDIFYILGLLYIQETIKYVHFLTGASYRISRNEKDESTVIPKIQFFTSTIPVIWQNLLKFIFSKFFQKCFHSRKQHNTTDTPSLFNKLGTWGTTIHLMQF